MVSGTLSLPSRGTFHHSLTVLSAIGHQGVFSLTRWSWQIHGRFSEPAATREYTSDRPATFAYRTLTAYGTAFQRLRLATGFLTARPVNSPIHTHPTTPHTQPLSGITRARFRLIRFRSPLLTESLNCFLFLRVLRCFTSPRYLHTPYVFRCG